MFTTASSAVTKLLTANPVGLVSSMCVSHVLSSQTASPSQSVFGCFALMAFSRWLQNPVMQLSLQ